MLTIVIGFLALVCLVLLVMVVSMSFRLNRLEHEVYRGLSPFPLTPDQIIREGGTDMLDEEDVPAFLRKQAD